MLGPTFGGYIADNYSWRWIFLINIPAGTVAFALNYALLEDPAYLKEERAAMRSRPLRFDYIGLGLIVLVMSSMEVLLSKGQEWDWYNDPFWRVQTLLLLFAGGGPALIPERRGSIGTSVGKTLVQRRLQFHDSRLVETLNPLNPAMDDALRSGRAFFRQFTGDPRTSEMMAYQAIDDLRQQQALSLSYLDAFWVCSMLAMGLIVLALFMRPSVAAKGEHLAAE